MRIFAGSVVVLIGLYNVIVLGIMEKTTGALNPEAKERNPKIYKWTRIISGVLVVIIGILIMAGLLYV